MSEVLPFLAAPFALAILLVGIHAYLGLHVLQRDVIFVDISLSQVAALGGVLSLFFNSHDHENSLGIIFSLTLCLAAALGLSLLRHYEKKVSQEAMIGMTYAMASGGLILLMDKLPHAAEHLKEALVGNILFVTWPKVFQTAIIYGIIGMIHFIYRKKFWACSTGKETSLFWDFLFYLLFGIVITFSTHHAGVLVVFSILVVPASFAKRILNNVIPQLWAAWAFGLFAILVAFLTSYKLDVPAGAAIVTTLTMLFFTFLITTLIWESKNK